MNQFSCLAAIAEREAVRYTPAGIPIVGATLQHTSRQIEAGVPRLIEMELNALVAGAITDRFCQLPMGVPHRFSGFLAHRRRSSKSLVFHITDFDIDSPDTGAKDGLR